VDVEPNADYIIASSDNTLFWLIIEYCLRFMSERSRQHNNTM